MILERGRPAAGAGPSDLQFDHDEGWAQFRIEPQPETGSVETRQAHPFSPMADDPTITEKPLTTGEWFVTLLVLALPLIGLIMYFVWGFGTGNIGRRNFCRATLLWIAVLFGLVCLALIGFLVLGGTLAALSHAGR